MQAVVNQAKNAPKTEPEKLGEYTEFPKVWYEEAVKKNPWNITFKITERGNA